MVAFDLLCSVGVKALVPDEAPDTVVTFFDVPLSGIAIPPGVCSIKVPDNYPGKFSLNSRDIFCMKQTASALYKTVNSEKDQ
jgi:hypothetical protein